MLHVAQFVHRYPPALGGAEAYVARLSEYLVSQGDAVIVFTTSAVELNELWKPQVNELEWEFKQNGVDVLRYPPISFPLRRYVLKALSMVPSLPWQAVFQPVNPICPRMWRDVGWYDEPLDAVHATAFPYAFPILCAHRLAKRRKVPFLLTPFLHLGDPTNPKDRTFKQYTRPHLKWLLNEADTVFVQTPSERDAVIELGVREDRVVLQGLGVDVNECVSLSPSPLAGEGLGVRGQLQIGHLANNSIEKGTVDLLRASEGSDAHVILAGAEMPNFQSFWQRFANKDSVTRLGVLTDEQKRDFFAGIDIFALPSRTDSFGLVLLEAWANGKPVVAYRAGGPADLIRHGVDGFLAKCGDVNDLRKQLQLLIDDPDLRARMGEAGRQRVMQEFQWEPKLKMFRDRILSLTSP